MLAKFIKAVLFFSLSSPIFSQTNSENGYICLSYSFGITDRLSPERAKYGNETGTVSSVEISNVPRENTGFFVNFTSTSYNLNEDFAFETNSNHILKNYGLSGGVRLYSSNKRVFFDAGVGCYNIEYFRAEWSFGDKINTTSFGVNFGLGTRLRIGYASSLVLKGKFNHIIYNKASEGIYREISFNAGIEMDNGKENFQSHRSGKASTGIIIGNSGRENDKFVGSYGAEFTFGVSDNFALVANYLHKSSDEYYTGYDSPFESWENNYAGGVRNYFGKNYLKPFLECLADVNIRKENTKYFAEDNILIKNSIGIVLGTGAEFELSDRVTGILKGNFTFFDNAENVAGMFGGLKYRF